MENDVGPPPPRLPQEGDGLGVQERLAEVVEEELLQRGELVEDVEHDLQGQKVPAVARVGRVVRHRRAGHCGQRRSQYEMGSS